MTGIENVYKLTLFHSPISKRKMVA